MGNRYRKEIRFLNSQKIVVDMLQIEGTTWWEIGIQGKPIETLMNKGELRNRDKPMFILTIFNNFSERDAFNRIDDVCVKLEKDLRNANSDEHAERILWKYITSLEDLEKRERSFLF